MTPTFDEDLKRDTLNDIRYDRKPLPALTICSRYDATMVMVKVRPVLQNSGSPAEAKLGPGKGRVQSTPESFLRCLAAPLH